MTAIHFRRRFFSLAIRTTPHGRLPPTCFINRSLNARFNNRMGS